jgi:AcrR family transcriptional regulator
MTGRREQNKARRRDAILDAALEMFQTQTLTSVTTEQIADRAGVSPATVYNLVGPREQLHLALVDRLLDGLVDALADPITATARDPIATARLIITHSTSAFVADAAAYRQIVHAVGELSTSGARLAIDPSQLQVAAMRDAVDRGLLRPDLDPIALGRQVYLSYAGALIGWAGGGLSDELFEVAALHGLYTVLAAAGSAENRPEFLRELSALGNVLAEST